MKIGILTWFMGMNYGAQAQTYALFNYLTAHGHDCCEIAYYPKHYKIINLRISLAIEPSWYLHTRQVIYSLQRMQEFAKFIKKHKLSKKVSTAQEIEELNLDAIVIGSDELANCRHPLHDSIYFGTDIKKTPILFYGLSCGALNTDYLLSENSRLALKGTKYLSGRDKNTCSLLENNGGDSVVQVLDPTMLYSFEEFLTLMPLKDYILLYSFDSLENYKEEIQQYAQRHSLQILSIGRYYKWADCSLPDASVSEWISAFRYAEIVITDSFHGLVFSVKNQKQFVLLGRSDKRSKNDSLLSEFDIQTDYYMGNESIENYFERNRVDYERVNKVLQKKVEDSSHFLLEGLEHICSQNY